MSSSRWIVDASVIVSYLLGEEKPETLEHYIFRSYAPRFAKLEVYNALWKVYTRQRGISHEKFEEAVEHLEKLDSIITYIDEFQVFRDAMEITLNYNITIYDAIYIALAKKFNTPLITKDKTQASVAQMARAEARLI